MIAQKIFQIKGGCMEHNLNTILSLFPTLTSLRGNMIMNLNNRTSHFKCPSGIPGRVKRETGANPVQTSYCVRVAALQSHCAHRHEKEKRAHTPKSGDLLGMLDDLSARFGGRLLHRQGMRGFGCGFSCRISGRYRDAEEMRSFLFALFSLFAGVPSPHARHKEQLLF